MLFIRVEVALSMALKRDPQLLEYAFSKSMILISPISLLAILKGLEMVIQQEIADACIGGFNFGLNSSVSA